MLSFENTEIAFKSKSDQELNTAYRLFKLVGKPWMVKLGRKFTNLALKLRLPITGIVKKTIFKQFCGGENIQECSSKIDELGKFGIGTILDYSVEGKISDEAFEATCNEIIETVNRANNNKDIPFAVFKITGISRFGLLEKVNNPNAELSQEERKEFAEVHQRVDKICRRAYETGTPVFIDAEDSWIQDAIDRLADAMMARYNKEKAIVYNTIQLYRHDRLQFLKDSYVKAEQGNYFLGVKLVRGAYMEKEAERAEKMGYENPIHKTKAATDKDYNLALEFCIQNIKKIAICAGTHNEDSSKLLAELIEKNGLDKNNPHLYFAQLLGMSDHISYNLSNAEFNVAKYVPYGPVKEVLPYLIRRAEENTSVAGQTSRELNLLIKERNRRKGK